MKLLSDENKVRLAWTAVIMSCVVTYALQILLAYALVYIFIFNWGDMVAATIEDPMLYPWTTWIATLNTPARLGVVAMMFFVLRSQYRIGFVP